MKLNKVIDTLVRLEGGFIVGKVKDFIIDPEDWKITHIEVELTKQTSEEVLGIKPAMLESPRNRLAISAVEKGAICCTDEGITLKVTKDQLTIYLRPA